jgi:hypothetical protein
MNIKSVLVEVAPGEMIDKITILMIKSERIKDEKKLANIELELGILSSKLKKYIPSSPELDTLISELKVVNEKLWAIEDDIRDCERKADFSQDFINLARDVYFTNDKRSNLKREINIFLGSEIIEEKSYKSY